MKRNKPLVGVIMGSQSDWETLSHASDTLKSLRIPHECEVVSAHRTPLKLARYAQSAADRGLKVIIAGAGGAAHLPGMTAASTRLPVLGVPVEGKAWVFDDTIEHEAWNRSDQTRVILLFDVWRAELLQEERDLVVPLFEAIDAHGGGRKPDWEI